MSARVDPCRAPSRATATPHPRLVGTPGHAWDPTAPNTSATTRAAAFPSAAPGFRLDRGASLLSNRMSVTNKEVGTAR